MSAPAIGRRRRWAPPITADIDWTHPLAAGLVACHLPVPGLGAIDLCGLTPLALVGAPVVGAGRWGRGMQHATTTGANATIGTTGALALQPPLSLMWVGDSTGALVNDNQLYGTFYDSGGGDPYQCLMLASQFSTTIQLCGNTGATGTFYNLDSAVSPARGGHVIVGSVSPAGQNIYVDGQRKATSATAVSSILYSASSEIRLGNRNAATNANLSVLGCVWRRELSANEVAALWADPFQFLRW